MHDIDELRQYIVLHARAQRIPERVLRTVLADARDDSAGPRSWTAAWSAQAEHAEAHGKHLLASGCYGLARFPYIDSPARARAHRECIAAFDRWRSTQGGMQRRTVARTDGTFIYYLQPPARAGQPLLLVLGGIVSLKEQWAPLVPLARRLGFGVAVTEMPGVGENTTRYTPDSWRQLPALIDDASQVLDASRCLVAGLSFGGHLAVTAALHDPRIRGIVTVGAPLTAFFTPAQCPSLPELTRTTLVHLTGIPPTDLPGALPQWALRPHDLQRLTVPVRYVASRRDEIVGPADVADLLRWVPDARCRTFDDVHGAPDHVRASRMYLIYSLLGMRRRLPRPTVATAAPAGTGSMR